MIINVNKSFSSDIKCNNGDIFENSNITQLYPDTDICIDTKSLTFIDCNLINCIIPDDAMIYNCNMMKISFCSHLHPELVSIGLSECSDECEHKVYGEEMTYKDKVIG